MRGEKRFFESLCSAVTLTMALVAVKTVGTNASLECPRQNAIFPSMNFEACQILDGESILQWKWNQATSSMDAAFSMRANSLTDYVAWGINEEGEADMHPSSVVICFESNGVMIGKQYYLSGMDPSDVNLGGKLNLSSLSCGSDTHSGKISVAFSAVLTSPTLATVWATGLVKDPTAFVIEEHCGTCMFSRPLTDFSNYTILSGTSSQHTTSKNVYTSTRWFQFLLLLPCLLQLLM